MRRSELQEKSVSALIKLRAAIAAGRNEEAAAQTRQLLVEWQEIRYLYPEFLRRAVAELRARAADQAPVEDFHQLLDHEFGKDYEAYEVQEALERGVEELARGFEAGTAGEDQLESLLTSYLDVHDRWRDQLSAAIDLGAELLGEARVGELWTAIEAEEIEGYKRYDRAERPWSESFDEVVQSAFTGMHGHLCGPRVDGEIEVNEHEDRVELRFSPCGSGGRIRNEERFGVTTEKYDWAWNKEGVCYYCAHCCVLQQLEPIDNLGMPVRVIEPPTSPGDSCSWTVYRSPELIPDSAYEAVGRRPPRRQGAE